LPGLLRASHIKPWAACESDAERLDVFNGLLLAPNLDAAFDQGFVTSDDRRALVASKALPVAARVLLGLHETMRVSRLTPRHREYLEWHREMVFRRQQ
jgi:putative restriction endonuclease